jgi:hypothetical protein
MIGAVCGRALLGFAVSFFGAGGDASNFALVAFATSGAVATAPATAFGAGAGPAIALATGAAVVTFGLSGATDFAI